MPTLTEATLRRAIAAGETTMVELKKAVPRPGKLAERMCGMANAQGGLIIIGVEDSSLKIVGVPDARMTLSHDMAKQRYTEQITALADQTGWRVYLYPHVSEKALIDAVKRVLPEGVSITGNASVYPHMRTVSVSCTGEMSAKVKEEVERRFGEETGWGLEVVVGVEEYLLGQDRG